MNDSNSVLRLPADNQVYTSLIDWFLDVQEYKRGKRSDTHSFLTDESVESTCQNPSTVSCFDSPVVNLQCEQKSIPIEASNHERKNWSPQVPENDAENFNFPFPPSDGNLIQTTYSNSSEWVHAECSKQLVYSPVLPPFSRFEEEPVLPAKSKSKVQEMQEYGEAATLQVSSKQAAVDIHPSFWDPSPWESQGDVDGTLGFSDFLDEQMFPLLPERFSASLFPSDMCDEDTCDI